MLSCEDESVWLTIVLCVFEEELHADVIEFGVLSDNDPFDEIEFVGGIGRSV